MLNNFLFFIAGLLTILVPIAIINLRNKFKPAKPEYLRQSYLFFEMKLLMPGLIESYLKRKTQAQSYDFHKPLNYIEMPDQKIYWLNANNIYYAEAGSDGRFNLSEGKRSQMNNLSEKEVVKMLFIYNSLKNG